MKQNKWQRLAAIGLRGSPLVNAFSGMTAVAEIMMIENSSTAENSVKEEIQVSSETQTTSEVTTETSQEEVTQETGKQAEVAVEEKEDMSVKEEQGEAEVQPTIHSERAAGVREAGKVSELSTRFESESESPPIQD